MLTDEEVAAIAADPALVAKIVQAARLMTMEGIAEELGISYYRVKILRGRRREGDQDPRASALPPPLPIPGGPVWHPLAITDWGRQTGRLDQEGKPVRARPTGRPARTRS